MPSDWWTWLGVIAGIIGIISFIAWIRERIQRQRQSDLLMGFLTALRAQANAMGQAGEEWRYNVGKNLASPADAAQYANVAVNNWLKLKDEIDKLLQQLEHQ